jgi:endonuclease-3
MLVPPSPGIRFNCVRSACPAMSCQKSRARQRIRTIVRRLERVYGPRPWRRHRGGIDGLIQTILSQNTSDGNSGAAFLSLRKRFPQWEQVLTARVSSIETAIRCGGLSRMKAPRIKKALSGIRESRGTLSLDFLDDMPLSEAKAYLESIEGVGPKTAACVLMFCYNRPALPVDTHVHRVARRLGLIPEKCATGPAHEMLEQMCPPELVYPFHVLMIEHGRKTCRARRPRCDECALADLCPSRE